MLGASEAAFEWSIELRRLATADRGIEDASESLGTECSDREPPAHSPPEGRCGAAEASEWFELRKLSGASTGLAASLPLRAAMPGRRAGGGPWWSASQEAEACDWRCSLASARSAAICLLRCSSCRPSSSYSKPSSWTSAPEEKE